MNALRGNRYWLCMSGLVVTACLLSGEVLGGKPLEEVRKGKVFVRLSPEALAEIKSKPFKHTTQVNDVILGTTVQGQCATNGAAELHPNKDEKGFKLTVTGQSITTSVGANGPATIRTTTITDFVAASPINFHPEHGFQAGDVVVNARTRINTDDVQAAQRGIVGRIVRGVAERRVEESKPVATQIAQQKTSKRIEVAITEQLAEKLKEVNRSLNRVKNVVAVLNPKIKTDACFCASKDHMLLYFQGEEIDHLTLFRELPEMTSASELWIHNSAIENDFAKQMTAFTTVRDSANTAIDTATKFFMPKTTTNVAVTKGQSPQRIVVAKPITEREEETILRRHGDWYVVRLPVGVSQVADQSKRQ